jgi:hypothetical protein
MQLSSQYFVQEKKFPLLNALAIVVKIYLVTDCLDLPEASQFSSVGLYIYPNATPSLFSLL